MYNLESSRESCYDLMSIIIVLPEVLTLYHVIVVCPSHDFPSAGQTIVRECLKYGKLHGKPQKN